VTGGIGKVLLERMGWRAGTGLGKHRAGITVPLSVDIKTDRRGLCSCLLCFDTDVPPIVYASLLKADLFVSV